MASAPERLLLILAGFLAAALAASAFLHLVLFLGAGTAPETAAWTALGSMLLSIPFTALFVAYVALVPAAAAAAVLEFRGVRGAFGNLLAGMVVGAAVALWLFGGARRSTFAVTDALDPSGAAPRAPVEWGLMAAIVAGGAVAGFAYWLVAGRSAGNWRAPPR